MALTEDELRRLAQAAYDRGDVSRARTFIAQLRSAGQQAEGSGASRPVYDDNGDMAAMRPPRADAPLGEATLRRTDAERFANDALGTVERYAPAAADVTRASASGLAQGVEGLANIVSAPGRLVDRGVDAALGFVGVGDGNYVRRGAQAILENQPPASALMRGTESGQQLLSYSPETTAGRYAQTVSRYVPGAVALGGGGLASTGGNILRYAAAPGIAEEAAGQAAERAFGPDSTAEAIIRPVAGLAAGVATARPTGQARPIRPRIDPEDARLTEVLLRHGVRPSVGEATGSGALRRLEGMTATGDDQIQQFNRAVMRLLGSDATRATPTAMQRAVDDIVRQMDDAVSGASITPTAQMAQRADDIILEYVENLPGGENNVTPAIRRIANEIADLATGPSSGAVPLETLRSWRRRLGNLMGSRDEQVRTASYGLRSLIDDMTQDALRAAGREADIELLSEANNRYRNWLAVAQARARAGAENGLISPTALDRAITTQQGWRSVATGATTDLGELSQAGAAILRPVSPVSPDGMRRIAGTSGVAGAVLGQQYAGDPVLGLVAGLTLPSVGQTVLRSNALQNAMMDPRGQFANALLGTSSGLGANLGP